MIRSIVLLCCLAACSGGGGVAAPSANGFNALHADVRALGVSYLAALPVTGVADYRGQARMDLPLGPAPAVPYYGHLALRVDFAGGGDAISGGISDFQGEAGALGGALQISNGMIHTDAMPARDYQFSADLAGTLAQNGQNYPVIASLSGDFRGATGEAISGAIHRGMIGQGEAIDSFHGVFSAKQVSSGG